MKQISPKYQVLAATASLGLVYASGASAFLFDVGNVAWRVDSELTSGVTVRVEEQNQRLIGLTNGGTKTSVNSDDGNLNFEQGDVTSAATKLTTDWSAQGENIGFAARTRFLYDPIYDDDKPLKNGRPALPKETQDKLGANFQAAEVYFVGNLDLGGHDTVIKLGKKVLNWGEAIFTPGGVNIDAVEVSNLRSPGAKIRDAFIGANMVNAYIDLSENLGLETFYQFGHTKTEPDAHGSYHSTNDLLDIAMLRFGAAPENDPDFTVERADDRNVRSGGQAGMSFRYYLDKANGIDIGMYFANYHSRLPVASGTAKNGPPSTGSYFFEYPEDNQLIGISANTALGDWSVYGEIAHHIGLPQQIDDVELLYAGVGSTDQLDADPNTPGSQNFAPGGYIQGYRRLDVSQTTIGGLRSLAGDSAPLWADSMVFIFEAAMNKVHDMPSEDELRFEGPGTPAKGGTDTLGASPTQQTEGFASDFSWGYKLIARLNYFSVADTVNLIPRLVFFHDVEGVTPAPTTTFVEGRKTAAAGVTMEFSRNFEVDLSYAAYFGGGDANVRNDRDNTSLSVAYRF